MTAGTVEYGTYDYWFIHVTIDGSTNRRATQFTVGQVIRTELTSVAPE